MSNVILKNAETINLVREDSEWLNVITQCKGYNYDEFITNFFKENEVFISIFRYRNKLIEQQNDIKNIDKQNIIFEAIQGKKYDIIKKEFSEMFLEVFSNSDINIMIKLIKDKEKLLKLIQLHNYRKTDRLMSILTRI